MPQLSKGGKWVFGWVIIGEKGEIRIPHDACLEYGFEDGMRVGFTNGSRRSGGFAMGNAHALLNSKIQTRLIAYGIIEKDQMVILPKELGAKPLENYLAVRGSGLALGFIQQGPIFEIAQEYQGIEMFTP